jgi:hypothetical protein
VTNQQVPDATLSDERLAGGHTGGAVKLGRTIRRQAGPWTASVHSVLEHLASRGFTGAPRPLGFDELGREILSYLPGATVGDQLPWPEWTHSEEALVQTANWLKAFHVAIADYVPPVNARWREGGVWEPGLIIGHNDAAPYNAAWQDGRLVGFFDWDFAAPVTPAWDLAFTAFAWVPLHARRVVSQEGFTAFDERPRRLRLFLDSYGWSGSGQEFVRIVQQRVTASADGILRTAAAGDPAYQRMIANGVERDLRVAVIELDDFTVE